MKICWKCWIFSQASKGTYFQLYSANIHLLKANNRNTKRCDICSELTLMTSERRHRRRSSVFICNFEHISHLFLVFLSLNLNKKMIAGEWHYHLTLIHAKRVGLANYKSWLIIQICKIMVAKFTNSLLFFLFFFFCIFMTICRNTAQYAKVNY